MNKTRSSAGDEETPRQNGSCERKRGTLQHRGNEDDDDEDDSGLGTTNLQDDNDPNLRREIRSKYRDLINSLQQEREDMISPSNNKLTEVLEQANRLFRDVREAREAALDAQLLVVASDLGKEKVSQLVSEGNSFDTTVFAQHLLTFMGLNQLEDEEEEEEEQQDGGAVNGYLSQEAWCRVARRAESCFKTAPSFHYMMGSFHAEPPPPKQRIERQRKVPNKEAKRMMPTQLKKMEESHQEATEKEVERILGFLRGYHSDEPSTPLSYYEFVINPNSFSRTVENMFHTSFLIRDGLARMYLDDGLPCIVPVDERDVEAGRSSGRKQCIISICQKTWREIIDAFEITDALIPPPDE